MFGLFVGSGPVVQVLESNKPATSFESEDVESCWKKPIVVICDGNTSAVAEVFAGAIRDDQRGPVIGDERTNGKGTVQNICPVRPDKSKSGPDYGAVKLTVAGLFRVNGMSIQQAGIPSDIVLPSLLAYSEPGEEGLENGLSFDPIPAAKYKPFTTYLNDSIVAELAENSGLRVLNSPGFKKVQDQITKYLRRQNERTVPLNESVMKARMAELKAAEDSARTIAASRSGSESFPKGFYNTEVIHIVMDYVQLLQAL